MARQQSFFTKLFCLYCILTSVFIRNCNTFNCHLPEGCRLEKIYFRGQIDFNEKGQTKYNMIVCDVKNEGFEFKFKTANTAFD